MVTRKGKRDPNNKKAIFTLDHLPFHENDERKANKLDRNVIWPQL